MASPLSSLPADAPQRAWRETREERRRARDDKRWREQRQTQDAAALAHRPVAPSTAASEEPEELPAHMSGAPTLSQLQSFTSWQASSAPVASGSSSSHMTGVSSSPTASASGGGGRSLSLKRRFEQTCISTPPTATPPMTSNAQAYPSLFAVPIASTSGASSSCCMDVETLLASGTSLALSPSAAVVAASSLATLPADASGDSKRRKLDRSRILGS